MKITISNIAWDRGQDKFIIPLLEKHSVKGVEIAPTKIWDNPTEESTILIKAYKNFWIDKGIKISSVQSILFGHPELTIFDNKKTREDTLEYISKMIKVSFLLGAKAIVFGSPKNRDRGDLKMKLAIEIAADFFDKVANVAKKYKINFCIEPNPKEYGTNFINKTEEAINLIKIVNNPYFNLHLDTGVMKVNEEDYEKAIKLGFPYLRHFHASEKHLLPIGESGVNHEKIAKALKKLNYKGWVSIEVRGLGGVKNLDIVEKSLSIISEAYS